jgi:hypothetical protein
MTRRFGQLLAAFSVLALSAAPAQAVWNGKTTAPFSVNAELRFLLSMERFLFLQVGSAGATVDTVTFNLGTAASTNQQTALPPTSTLGNGTKIAAATGGAVNVILRGNGGSVTLAASNDGGGLGLRNGAGRYLNYDQILTQSTNPSLPAPVLTNSGSTAVTINGNAYGGRVVNTNATWNFSFANTAVPSAGNYTGRVTYTAANP